VDKVSLVVCYVYEALTTLTVLEVGHTPLSWTVEAKTVAASTRASRHILPSGGRRDQPAIRVRVLASHYYGGQRSRGRVESKMLTWE